MADNKITLTSRETEVLALAWQSFETDPKVNMEKLAALTGVRTVRHRRIPIFSALLFRPHPTSTSISSIPHTNPPQYTPGSAYFTLRKIKSKLKAMAAGADASSIKPPMKKKKSSGASTNKKRAAAAEEDDEHHDDDEQNGSAKPRKRGKMAAGPKMGGHEGDGRAQGGVRIKDEPEETRYDWGVEGFEKTEQEEEEEEEEGEV